MKFEKPGLKPVTEPTVHERLIEAERRNDEAQERMLAAFADFIRRTRKPRNSE